MELGGEISLDSRLDITITKDVVLDLKGHTVTKTYGANNHFFMTIRDGGSLTLTDSVGSGALIANHPNYGYGIQLYSNSTFIMNGGSIQTTQESIDIYTITNNVTIEINGGEVVSTDDNVLGIRGDSNIKVDIKGGTLTSGSDGRVAVYVSSYEENAIAFNISGGSITKEGWGSAIQAYSGSTITVSDSASIVAKGNSSAIQVQGGETPTTLNVNGGAITSENGNAVSVEDSAQVNISGGTLTGNGWNASAVYATEDANVKVTGGKLSGKKAAVTEGTNGSDNPTITITSGEFSSDVSAYVPEGNKAVYDEETGSFIIDINTTGDNAAVAEVNGFGYKTVQAAVNAIAATEGKSGTINVIKNSVENVTIPAGATVTLNIAEGVTLSGGTEKDAAGKSHTIANNGTLTVTGTGTVENNNGGSGALFNNLGATANLNGSTFTGTTWYVLKNLGTMSINGASVIQKDANSSAIANGWYGNASTDCNVTYPGDGTTAKLTIFNGTFSGGMNTVKNDDYGVLDIQNGTFTNTNGPAILNWNVATISGGNFTVNNTASSVIANGYLNDTADKGQLTITGGTFTASNGGTGALFGYGVGSADGGSFSITGGKFVGSLAISDDSPYTPVISGGTFTQEVPKEFCAEGYNPTDKDADGNYTVCGHDNIVSKEYKAPTCETDGNIAYWYCPDCGRYFSDENLQNEIAEADTILKAPGHDFKWIVDKEATETESGLMHQECTVCGYKKPAIKLPAKGTAGDHSSDSSQNTQTPSTSGSSSNDKPTPDTGAGDNNMVLWIAAILLAAGSLTGIIAYSRKRKIS